MTHRIRTAIVLVVCAVIYVTPLFAFAAVPIWAKVFDSYLGGDGLYYPADPVVHTDGGGVGASAGWGNHDLPSYADIFMTSNPRHYIVGMGNLEGKGTTGSKGWVYDKSTYQSTWTSVTPGTPLTLEWSCMPTQEVISRVQGPCIHYEYTGCQQYSYSYFHYYYTDYPSATINGVAGKRPMSSIDFKATDATTNYTVSCTSQSKTGLGWAGGKLTDPMPDISLKVIVDACPGAAPAAPNNADGLILKPGATVKVTTANGRGYCFNNATGVSYFIPNNNATELASFIKGAMAGNLKDSSGNAVTYFPPSN